MHRIVAIILSLAILLSSVAFAYEIEFRNIPWFCKPEEFENYLSEDGIEFKYASGSSSYVYNHLETSSWGNTYGEAEWTYLNVPRYTMRLQHPDKEKYILDVAGYSVSSIKAVFLPGYNIEKKIIGPAKSASLVKAEYTLYGRRTDGTHKSGYEAYEDLVRKLTNVYGTPTASGTETMFSVTDYTTWWANDATAVTLERWQYGITDTINIVYSHIGVKNPVEIIDSIVQAQIAEEQAKEAQNTDGL